MDAPPETQAIAALIAALRRQGIADERVLRALGHVPRHRFVPPEEQADAWLNVALPIAEGQTISQPFVVALMSQALGLKGHERVLEIGTGSGYQAAVLATLAGHVWSVERHQSLADRAGTLLTALGYRNVDIAVGDGTIGWPEHAPYEGILVTAGSPSVPPDLLTQLRPDGGRLVIPVGTLADQRLVLVEKRGMALKERDLGPVKFVPLLGASGWTTAR